MTHHHLNSSPDTCHWGFFEANLKPVLTVASGDEVTIDTITGGPETVPDKSRFHVPPELFEVHARNERMVPGQILTGPVAVTGAEPGDVLDDRLTIACKSGALRILELQRAGKGAMKAKEFLRGTPLEPPMRLA